MQLRIARLCLDCDEIHDAQQCPVCASEMFAYMTRWVPAPERRHVPRETPSPRADVYAALTDEKGRTSRRMLKGGVLGLTAVGLVGWFMRNPRAPVPRKDTDEHG
jgi:hypothetical protein